MVWDAWTKPDNVRAWFAPDGYTAPSADIDLRVGGKYLYAMRSADGQMTWTAGEFREVEPMRRLVYTDSFADEQGNPLPPTRYGMPGDFPQELVITVKLEGGPDGQTRLTISSGWVPPSEVRSMQAGWDQALHKLATLLAESAPGRSRGDRTVFIADPGTPEVVVRRFVHAGRERVWQVLNDPDMVPKWWGPSSLTTTVLAMEVTPGGIWNYVQRDAEGTVYPFRGAYRVVDAPCRLVRTFEYLGAPGHVLLETVTLDEKNGGTLVTNQSVFRSVAERDAMIAEGMESGARESMDRLAALMQ